MPKYDYGFAPELRPFERAGVAVGYELHSPGTIDYLSVLAISGNQRDAWLMASSRSVVGATGVAIPNYARDYREQFRREQEDSERREAEERAVVARRIALRPVFEGLGSWGWVRPAWGSEDMFERGGIWRDQSHADEYFVREYRKNRRRRLNALFGEFNEYPLLSRWSLLLDQILFNARKDKFAICVPALLAMLEGVAVEYAGSLDTKMDAKQAIDRLVSTQPPAESWEVMNWLDWLSIRSFVRMLFRTHAYRKGPPTRINRHWILHGRSTPVLGELESLQLLQAIDLLGMDHFYATM